MQDTSAKMLSIVPMLPGGVPTRQARKQVQQLHPEGQCLGGVRAQDAHGNHGQATRREQALLHGKKDDNKLPI